MTVIDTAVPTTTHPFHTTREEERRLRVAAERMVPALTIAQPVSFDGFVQQLMVPPAVMDLARKAHGLRLSVQETEAIRHHLRPVESGKKPGLLRRILMDKAKEDGSHPPYIRVACTGKGTYDHWAKDDYLAVYVPPSGDFGSPAVLEIWPAQHYSPIHSHGHTTGIIHCLTGQLDIMAYGSLAWNAEKMGLYTLTPGQTAWLAGDTFAVHKVYCPFDGGTTTATGPGYLNKSDQFAASFHVYLNDTELSTYSGLDPSRDRFHYIDETDHTEKVFTTYSDLSWHVLAQILAQTELD
ncbi:MULTISPECIES: hypothetical protein [Streptomyces]|uniref:Cysteine dioxygenase n=1 Tax=Streptomyces luteosporeus TaxID=173856 RepID=A0ABN3U6B2_9ACTN